MQLEATFLLINIFPLHIIGSFNLDDQFIEVRVQHFSMLLFIEFQYLHIESILKVNLNVFAIWHIEMRLITILNMKFWNRAKLAILVSGLFSIGIVG